MKKNMSTVVFILLIIGFVYLILFNKPHNHTEAGLASWFSSKLSEIATKLEKDIKKDKKGEYPHSGQQTLQKRGMITYVLMDKKYARFDISDKNDLNKSHIMQTDGYRELEAKARELNLSIILEEKEVEGDDVETFDELDEYTDDFPRYYQVTVSGW